LAVDPSSPQSSASGRIAGLEVLQPEMSSSDLSVYVGLASLIVIFAEAPDDAEFIAQIEALRPNADELAERNVVLLTDTAPAERGPLRQSLRPRGFNIILIDSMGTLVQRRGSVIDARTLIRQIAQMP
jgi:hypothetical protein